MALQNRQAVSHRQPPIGVKVSFFSLNAQHIAVVVGALAGVCGRMGLASSFHIDMSSTYVNTDFIANVLGSFMMGIWLKWKESRPMNPAYFHAGFGVGFLGSLTTFSSWMSDVSTAAEDSLPLAFGVIFIPAVSCVVAVKVGERVPAAVGRLRVWFNPDAAGVEAADPVAPVQPGGLFSASARLIPIYRSNTVSTGGDGVTSRMDSRMNSLTGPAAPTDGSMLTSESAGVADPNNPPRDPMHPYHVVRRGEWQALAILWIFITVVCFVLACWFWTSPFMVAVSLAPVGALLRKTLSALNNNKSQFMKRGTLLANTLGTVLIAVLLKWTAAGDGLGLTDVPRESWDAIWSGMSIGFCGCLTTVSSLVGEASSLGPLQGTMYLWLSIAVNVVLASFILLAL